MKVDESKDCKIKLTNLFNQIKSTNNVNMKICQTLIFYFVMNYKLLIIIVNKHFHFIYVSI